MAWAWPPRRCSSARGMRSSGTRVTSAARLICSRQRPASTDVAVGDLSSAAETRSVANQVNALGHFNTVIHNAGVGYRENRKVTTVDGHAYVLAVNVLAPSCSLRLPSALAGSST